MWDYRAKLNRLVDADTIDLDVDLGLETFRRIRVRINGADAAPGKSPEGIEATEWAAQWFMDNADPDGWVIVQTVKDRTELHGRYLAYVRGFNGAEYIPELIAAGHAVAASGRRSRPVPA